MMVVKMMMMKTKLMTICKKWGIWLETPRISVSNSDASLPCCNGKINHQCNLKLQYNEASITRTVAFKPLDIIS